MKTPGIPDYYMGLVFFPLHRLSNEDEWWIRNSANNKRGTFIGSGSTSSRNPIRDMQFEFPSKDDCNRFIRSIRRKFRGVEGFQTDTIKG